MGRIPCCEKDSVKRGQWTPEEDTKLASYIAQNGTRNWRLIPKNAGLQRCGKSCRLRWTNYLRPDLKHGDFNDSEEDTIIKFHSVVGNRWALIAAQLPGRTDNDVKNHWNTKLKKKLSGMGIDPVTHKPFSHLMAEIATTLPPPQVAHLAEAALGCFKDEMLHLLSKKRVEFTGQASTSREGSMAYAPIIPSDNKEDAIQKIKLGLSRAIMQEPSPDRAWAAVGSAGESSDGLAGISDMYDTFRYSVPVPYSNNDGEGSTWSQSLCNGSSCIGGAGHQQGGGRCEKEEYDDGEEAEGGKLVTKDEASMFASDCVLWDISDDLMNPMV